MAFLLYEAQALKGDARKFQQKINGVLTRKSNVIEGDHSKSRRRGT